MPSQVSLVISLALLHLLCLVAFQPPQEHLILQRSPTPSPYIGEEFEAHIDFRIPGKSEIPFRMTIPWLEQEMPGLEVRGWRWACQTSKRKDALMLRWNHTLIGLDASSEGTFNIVIPVRITDPLPEDVLVLSPVTLELRGKRYQSNTVRIPLRAVPIPTSRQSGWNMGLGTYQCKASWVQESIELGKETTLQIAVSGKGSLQSISRLAISSLPGWSSDSVLMDEVPETWDEAKTIRYFRWNVRPRKLRDFQPPSISAYFWNPKAEQYESLSISVPPLKVIHSSSRSYRQLPPLPYPDAKSMGVGISQGILIALGLGGFMLFILLHTIYRRWLERRIGTVVLLRRAAWRLLHRFWNQNNSLKIHERTQQGLALFLEELLNQRVKPEAIELRDKLEEACAKELLTEVQKEGCLKLLEQSLMASFAPAVDTVTLRLMEVDFKKLGKELS